MARPRHDIILMILLIGNYPLDRQQSMQRFAIMMLAGLTAAGIAAEIIYPKPFLEYIQQPVNAVVKQVRPDYQIPGAKEPQITQIR